MAKLPRLIVTLAVLATCLSFGVLPTAADRPSEGGWVTKSPMWPQIRGGVVAPTQSNKIFVIDGWACGLGDTSLTFVYDVAKDTWQSAAPSGIRRAELAGVEHGGKIYVLGGRGPGGTGIYSTTLMNELEVYDTEANTWQTLPPMPTARAGLGAAIVGNTLYAIGGRVGWAGGVLKMGQVVNTVEAYDINTGRWTTKSPLPTPRSDLVVLAHGGKIYAIGGWDGTSNSGGDLATVEVYDPGKDRWTKLPSSMPTPRTAAAGAVLDNSIYVVGGMQGMVGPSTELPVAEAYDVLKGRWRTIESMPTARAQLGVAASNSQLFAIGGGYYPDIAGECDDRGSLNEVYIKAGTGRK